MKIIDLIYTPTSLTER